MKKINVLRKNWQFQEIIDSRKQIVSNFLIFYFRETKNELKVGISISKKFANAVLRNKYRRQTRAALDVVHPWEKKYEIVIMIRKPFFELSHEQKVAELRKMFERMK